MRVGKVTIICSNCGVQMAASSEKTYNSNGQLLCNNCEFKLSNTKNERGIRNEI